MQLGNYGQQPMMRTVLGVSELVVMIVEHRDERLNFFGSGFVCSQSGHVITCAHILDLTADLHLVAPPPIDAFAPITAGQVQAVPLMVAQVDAANDVALLKPRDDITANIPSQLFGRGEQTLVGQSVGCLGIPYGSRGLHTLKLTSTVVCGKSTSGSGSKRIHLDANMHDGNSGGPVISATSGQIIGIVAERFSPTGSSPSVSIGDFPLGTESTISFAIPIEYAFPLLREDGVNV